MRRLSAILVMTLLILLQYGKISNYLFCEWQASFQNQLPDCNCTWILDGVFDGEDHSEAAISVSKEKSADYIAELYSIKSQPVQSITLSFPVPLSARCTDGFGQPSPRPPIS